MTDNARAYRRSNPWRDALAQINACAVFTRNYRPQTNGKAERFNRTLLEEWAYAQPFNNSTERAEALPTWLYTFGDLHRSEPLMPPQPHDPLHDRRRCLGRHGLRS